jgi:ABC-2 type transport system ATP-binding protein
MPRDTDTEPAALEVAGLSHAFGARRVLRDVGFRVLPGDFCVLLGLNGAGKTTLFALATRLFHARAGSIRVFGYDIARESSAALARMGVVFQQPTLDLDLSVMQNMDYHAALHGLPRQIGRERAMEELERTGLLGRAKDRARALSGGQRRRVELARSLLHSPGLLLLDEPTVGLDIESRRALLAHVRGLCAERGLGVLWATHLIDEADDQSRVIVLHKGVVLAAGAVPEVVTSCGARDLRETFDKLVRAVEAPA